jgi:hypothetical protein
MSGSDSARAQHLAYLNAQCAHECLLRSFFILGLIPSRPELVLNQPGQLARHS